MAISPAVLIMTQAISLGLAFLRRIAAPEFSRGFQPTERLENIPASRERRLNSIVADATRNEKRAHRGLKPTAKFRRRYAASRCETLSLPPLKLRHSHVKYAPRHCVGKRLKFHGDALFASRQLFGQRIFEIEKLARMNF